MPGSRSICGRVVADGLDPARLDGLVTPTSRRIAARSDGERGAASAIAANAARTTSSIGSARSIPASMAPANVAHT